MTSNGKMFGGRRSLAYLSSGPPDPARAVLRLGESRSGTSKFDCARGGAAFAAVGSHILRNYFNCTRSTVFQRW
jgi:hypothetical protein